MKDANTLNHNGDGQNVLYADGHVEFQNTPFCGMLRNAGDSSPRFRDNIYTYGAGSRASPGVGVRGAPADALDSVLLPTSQDGPDPSPTVAESLSPRSSPRLWLVGGTVVALGAWWALRRGRRRRPMRATQLT
jgi:prepilin-type processing-associated H-X9-DG protein